MLSWLLCVTSATYSACNMEEGTSDQMLMADAVKWAAVRERPRSQAKACTKLIVGKLERAVLNEQLPVVVRIVGGTVRVQIGARYHDLQHTRPSKAMVHATTGQCARSWSTKTTV